MPDSLQQAAADGPGQGNPGNSKRCQIAGAIKRSNRRSLTSKLSRRLAEFGALNLNETIDPVKVDAFVAKKAAAHDEIEHLQDELKTLKEQRKETPSPVPACLAA
jgi:hypothetical protein